MFWPVPAASAAKPQRSITMDMFLSVIVLFMVANLAIVVGMLRRVDLNNDSVLAWELSQQYAIEQQAVSASHAAPMQLSS